MRAELRTELMALIHASVEALDGSDALACGFVAFCKGCNGKARVFCHPIYATLSCLFLTAIRSPDRTPGFAELGHCPIANKLVWGQVVKNNSFCCPKEA